MTISQDVWFSEDQTKDLRISFRINKVLYCERSPYQLVAVYETLQCGKLLSLDNVVQTTVMDEFTYHEMIAHVGLNTVPEPRKVLVIGGGDGGTLREVVRHPRVEKAVMVEIDAKVVEAAKLHLPEIGSAFDDPKAELIIDDGIKHVKENQNTYDLIIVDSTDPVGPAVGLFGEDFYRSVYAALREEGVLVAQTESPFYNLELITTVNKILKGIFPIVRVYTCCVPTYPGGLWSFTLASKKFDPLAVDLSRCPNLPYRYYSPELHRAAFVLPAFLSRALQQ